MLALVLLNCVSISKFRCVISSGQYFHYVSSMFLYIEWLQKGV